MSTRRFSKLNPGEAIDVLNAFLGEVSSTKFTEKLAGQHFAVTIQPEGNVLYRGKGGKVTVGGGLFPQITKILSKSHPPVSEPVGYEFEVLKKKGRSDFIDYPVDKDYTVVELTGAMSQETADQLNSVQGMVHFLSQDAIKKSPASYVKDASSKQTLQSYRDLLASGGTPSREQSAEVEELLMSLVDSGQIPSSLGGEKIEGLFGKTGSGTFKIPSKSYEEIQSDQSKFVGIGRRVPMKDIVTRFQKAADAPMSDKLVADVLEYVQKMTKIKPQKGFRTFFSPSEMSGLSGLAAAYQTGDIDAGSQLAQQFFKRVNTKGSWVSTSVAESKQISLLRRLIKEHLRTR